MFQPRYLCDAHICAVLMKAVAELNWLELFLAHSMKLLRSNLLPKLLPILMPKRSMPPLLLLITLVRPLQLKCLSFIQINSWIQNAAPPQSVGVKGDPHLSRRVCHSDEVCVTMNIWVWAPARQGRFGGPVKLKHCPPTGMIS